MLRSMLIGLDGTEDGEAAVELGLRWATDHDALAVGVVVVDTPGILNSGAVLFSETSRHPVAATLIAGARQRAGEIERRFVDRCRGAGVRYAMRELTGSPSVEFFARAQRHDLILLGQRTHFDYGREVEPDETLGQVIRDSPRPVVAVPRGLNAGTTAVVAYDGSLQAAHALYAFEASGLGHGIPVHVVSVAADRDDAEVIADRGVEFLRSHGLEAHPHATASRVDPSEEILKQVERLDAGLLVMGAYGQPVLREFFLGSATRTVLERSPVPVFCYH